LGTAEDVQTTTFQNGLFRIGHTRVKMPKGTGGTCRQREGENLVGEDQRRAREVAVPRGGEKTGTDRNKKNGGGKKERIQRKQKERELKSRKEKRPKQPPKKVSKNCNPGLSRMLVGRKKKD